MEKQSNTMQCIPSFFVSLDKIATFVKSVLYSLILQVHIHLAGGKRLFSCNVFGVFLFHVFHSKSGVIHCISWKKIAVTSNLQRRSGDLRTRLKINWKVVCPLRILSEYIYSLSVWLKSRSVIMHTLCMNMDPRKH